MAARDGAKILHVDMDAFFASVEQRDNPSLRGRPVVVGGSPHSRGVVSTASYEARKFGIHSAMPSAEAYALCPQAVFVEPHFDRYVEASEQIRGIFARYTDLVEPMSLDEAYLDVSDCADAVVVAREIKAAIADEVHLTASVGVAPNKFLAKLASDLDKPNGFMVMTPEVAAALLPGLPIRRLWGVGARTEMQLNRIGVFTFADFTRLSPSILRRYFGARAEEMLALARGVDHRPVEVAQTVKSVGEETTFAVDEGDMERLAEQLRAFSLGICDRLTSQGLKGRTVVLKVRFPDFTNVTRSHTESRPTADPGEIYATARGLLERLDLRGRRVRLIGLSVSNLTERERYTQLTLGFA